MAEKMTFAQAMMKEFKKLEQTTQQFIIELKALDDNDKAFYRDLLNTCGKYELI